jgi:hypothetical protein
MSDLSEASVDRARGVLGELVRDDERWSNFLASPAEVLRGADIDLQGMDVGVYILPEQILEFLRPECPDGWEPRLVYETKCVCVEWVELNGWDPNLDSSFPPKGPDEPPSGAWVSLGIFCRRKELRRIPTWVCERQPGWPCR